MRAWDLWGARCHSATGTQLGHEVCGALSAMVWGGPRGCGCPWGSLVSQYGGDAGCSGDVGSMGRVTVLWGRWLDVSLCHPTGIEVSTLFWPAVPLGSERPVLFQLRFWDCGESALRKFEHLLPVSWGQTWGGMWGAEVGDGRLSSSRPAGRRRTPSFCCSPSPTARPSRSCRRGWRVCCSPARTRCVWWWAPGTGGPRQPPPR